MGILLPTMKNFLIIVEAILRLTGASCIEDLDEETLDRFDRLEDFPIEINYCSKQALVESGLMSSYQAASLIEYRERTGGIFSVTELGLIDGFDQETARALSNYVSFDSVLSPGQRPASKGRHKLSAKGSDIIKEQGRMSGSCKYSYEGRRVSLNIGAGISEKPDGSVCLAYSGRGALRLLVLGDYNLRYGQGTALWSGFSLSGFPTVDAIYRKPAGICRSCSSSLGDKYRGAAAGFELGRFSADLFYAYGCLAGGNVSFNGKSFSVDVTAYCSESLWTGSLSARGTVRKVDLFGEITHRTDGNGTSVLAGAVWNAGYKIKAGLRAYIAGNSRQAAFGIQFRDQMVTVDYNEKYLKCIYNGMVNMMESDKGALQLRMKASARYKDKWKYELRLDARAQLNGFEINGRYDILWNVSRAWLWYIEGGYKGESFSTFLRAGIFLIDNWDDRIYVYERDAPDCFNVPAYYGRGWNASWVVKWKGLGLRAGLVRYPWSAKTPKTEIKVSYVVKW